MRGSGRVTGNASTAFVLPMVTRGQHVVLHGPLRVGKIVYVAIELGEGKTANAGDYDFGDVNKATRLNPRHPRSDAVSSP